RAVRGQGELDGEDGAQALPGAVGAHRAAVEVDQRADDCEAEAKTSVPSRGGAVCLAESFEDVRQEAGVDAFARVADDDARVRLQALEGDLHPPAARRELHRIREQV